MTNSNFDSIVKPFCLALSKQAMAHLPMPTSQGSAKQGPDLRFVVEATSVCDLSRVKVEK